MFGHQTRVFEECLRCEIKLESIMWLICLRSVPQTTCLKFISQKKLLHVVSSCCVFMLCVHVVCSVCKVNTHDDVAQRVMHCYQQRGSDVEVVC